MTFATPNPSFFLNRGNYWFESGQFSVALVPANAAATVQLTWNPNA
jgi:hypothetical protein